MATKKKNKTNENVVKLDMTFEEAMKKALSTPIKKTKPSFKQNKK